jgi:hypothetical protein
MEASRRTYAWVMLISKFLLKRMSFTGQESPKPAMFVMVVVVMVVVVMR